MSKILALLSGKGGSGKTTMALSMSNMLSNCGIKTLLIDCDLTTNGATYFYEDELTNKKVSSFCDLLHDSKAENFICINDNLDFLPSINRIDSKNTNSYSYRYKNDTVFKDFCDEARQKYDIIILDCQAGYTDVLKTILQEVDINLFVMEADAISSSAIRSLYLKVGKIIENKKSFQIINKATKEEYEIYSKSTGITLFTNIEIITFDWKIRKAFSLAQIPDLKNTSANYGGQLYNICKFLFKDDKLKAKIKKYKSVIDYNNNLNKRAELEAEIKNIKFNKVSSRNIIQKLFVPIIVLAISITQMILGIVFVNSSNTSIISDFFDRTDLGIIEIIVLCFVAAGFVLFNLWYTMDSRKNRKKYFRELEIYDKSIRQLENENERIIKENADIKELFNK